jgi:EamA domain-containing membrane protein RarD
VNHQQCRKANTGKENEMNTKTEGILAIIAALIVLFSAMWDPRISATVSIVALLAFGIYKFSQKQS